MLEMIAKLDKVGVHVEPEAVMALAPNDTSVGRPHLAAALVEAGHVADSSEAFDRYLGNGGPGYVPKARLEPEEAIGLIRRLDGLPVLAHPGVCRLDGRFTEFKDVGLGGLEVWHPMHKPSDVERYSRLALTHGLAASGGSDFHGPGRTEAPLGCFKIGREILDRLKARHAAQGQRLGTGFPASKNCLFRELNRGIEWVFTNNAVALQRIIDDHLDSESR